MSVQLNELQMISFKIKKYVPRQLNLKEEFQVDLLQKEVIVLEYLSYFAKKMLNAIKLDHLAKLKLVDYTSIAHFGVFAIAASSSSSSSSSPTSPQLSPSRRTSSLEEGMITPAALSKKYSENFEDQIFVKYRRNLEVLFKLHE